MRSLASSPPKEKRAVTGALIRSNQLTAGGYHQALPLQPDLAAQWQREENRLAAEYRRSGHPRHLHALCRHRNGVNSRLGGKAVWP